MGGTSSIENKEETIVALSKQLKRLGTIGLLCAGVFLATASQADSGFAIEAPGLPLTAFATSDTVNVKIIGPSSASIERTTLRLNGRNVTRALHRGGTAGSMTGTVSGFRPGSNSLRLFRAGPWHDQVAQLVIERATTPIVACPLLLTTGLANLIAGGISPDSVLTAANLHLAGEITAAGVPLPEHCQITGTLEPRVGIPNNRAYGTRFELRLPTDWNGRFFFQGQGGTGGSVVTATGQSQLPTGQSPPLAAGWAVVSFDGGHEGGDVMFGLDPKAKTDFAYHSMDIATVAAKSLIHTYYGRLPDRSYFVGCSNGGRQGMMFSQMFPDYYDGIINGDATYRLSVSYVDAAWGLQDLTSIAPPDANGNPILSEALSDPDLQLLAKDILAVCDAKDGVLDGMVLNTSACRFEDYHPSRLQCRGAKDSTCLSAAQVGALEKLLEGARNSKGQQLYDTWPWDPGMGTAQWRSWKLGTSLTPVPNAIKASFCNTSVGYLYLTPPDPTFACLNMNFDTDPARLAQNSWLDADNPDLNAFHRHGGKILWYHGTADPSTPFTEIIRYLKNMTAVTTHSERATADFARAFFVPGMNHCNGGAGLDNFDPLTPMVNWVENGIAPERIIVQGTNFPGRTRPLCAYPSSARYTGNGSIEDANNFVCQRDDQNDDREGGDGMDRGDRGRDD